MRSFTSVWFLWMTGLLMSQTVVAQQGKFIWAKQIGQTTTFVDRLSYDKGVLCLYGQFSGTQVIGDNTMNSTAGNVFALHLAHNTGQLEGIRQNPVTGFPLENNLFLQFLQFSTGYVLRKVDANGKIVWSKQLSVTGGITEITDIVEDPATGSIFTIGTIRGTQLRYDGKTHPLTNNVGLYALKFDKFGNLVWSHPLAGGSANSAIGIEVYANSDVVAVYESNEDIIIHRINQAPGTVWRSVITHSAALDGIRSVVTSADNLYIGGRFEGHIIVGTRQVLQSNGGYDCFMAKLDGKGQTTWAVGFGGTMEETLNDFEVDDKENIQCVGQFQKRATFGIRTIADNQADVASRSAFVSKLNARGTFDEVQAVVPTLMPGGSTSSFTRIAMDPLGNTYIVGRARGLLTMGNGVTTGQSNATEEYTFVCQFRPDVTSSTKDQAGAVTPVAISPNPSDGHFTLQLPEDASVDRDAIVDVFTSAGQLVSHMPYEQGMAFDLSSGLYFVRVRLRDGSVFRGKAVVR
jgi:hypothetical protein